MNLRYKISRILKRDSCTTANLWLQHFWIGEVESYETEVIHVNDYLRRQLGKLPANTIPVREHLLDNVPEEVWLEHFKEHVAPIMISQGLPVWWGE